MTRIKGSMAEIWLQMGATTPPSSPIKIKKKKKRGRKIMKKTPLPILFRQKTKEHQQQQTLFQQLHPTVTSIVNPPSTIDSSFIFVSATPDVFSSHDSFLTNFNSSSPPHCELNSKPKTPQTEAPPPNRELLLQHDDLFSQPCHDAPIHSNLYF
jgi:hypothetical protein